MGESGLKLSALGLGSWITFGGQVKDERLIREIYASAYRAGIRLFDTASSYAKGDAERLMGRALQGYPREHLVLSSKAYFPLSDDPNDRGLSRKHLIESVHKSLRHLATDYLDLFFCHRFDPQTPLEETLRTLEDLVEQGKILYWGTSEWRGHQIDRAHRLAKRRGWVRPRVEQPELSLLERVKYSWDTRSVTRRRGMGLVTFSPLASGRLTGKYDAGIPAGSRLDRVGYCGEFTRQQREKSFRFKGLADELGCSRAQLAIAWVLAQPGVSSVLTGASSQAQLEENLGALALELSPAMIRRIDRLFAPGIKRILRFNAGRHLRAWRDALS